jgi:hypothetical protein
MPSGMIAALRSKAAATPQRNAIPLKAMRMYAPHTSHDRRFGLKRMYRNRSGRFRSQTRRKTVASEKRQAIMAATTPNGSRPAPPSASTAATPSAPAAIDFVQRYVETRHPHGVGWLTSYTSRAVPSAYEIRCGLASRAVAGASASWPQSVTPSRFARFGVRVSASALM